jgi:hypothetical protein
MPTTSRSSVIPGLVRALIEHNPDMRLRDLLADPVVGQHVRNMRLGELVGAPSSANGSSRRRSAQPKTLAVAKSAGTKSSDRVDTRSAKGRADYDAKVLGAISNAKGELVSATQVRGLVGGDPMQFRAAADRLVRAKKIKVQGKARGTRYRTR